VDSVISSGWVDKTIGNEQVADGEGVGSHVPFSPKAKQLGRNDGHTTRQLVITLFVYGWTDREGANGDLGRSEPVGEEGANVPEFLP
jgi:hypothetical protein